MKRAAHRSRKFCVKYASTAVTRSRQASVPGAKRNYTDHAHKWEEMAGKLRLVMSRLVDPDVAAPIRHVHVFGYWAYAGELFRMVKYSSGERAWQEHLAIREKYEGQGLAVYWLDLIARDVFRLAPAVGLTYHTLEPGVVNRLVKTRFNAWGTDFLGDVLWGVVGVTEPDVIINNYEEWIPTQIAFDVLVQGPIARGVYDTEVYKVLDPEMRAVLPESLLVQAAAPELNRISPSIVMQGATYEDFEVEGTGFDHDSECEFYNGGGEPALINLTNKRVESTNLMLYDMFVDPECPLGMYDLVITTGPPGGGSDLLPDALEVESGPNRL